MSGGEIKNEEIKVPVKVEANENKMKQNFEDNLKNIKSVLDTQDDYKNGKKLEDADNISNMLDCSFEAGLNTLNADTKGKEDIKNMFDNTNNILNKDFKEKAANDPDRMAIEALKNFLLPMFADVSEGININTTNQKAEGYNANENGGKSIIEGFKTDLQKNEYKYLPGIQTIEAALNNPSKANIQVLQTFLLSKITDTKQKLDFYKSSWKGQKNATQMPTDIVVEPDGGFGEGTKTALKNYLDNFSKTYNENLSNKDEIITQTETKKEEIKNKQDKQEKIKVEETNTDTQAQKNLDKSDVTYSNPEQINKEVSIEGGQVKYRGESKNIFDLSNNNLNRGGKSFAGPLLPVTNVDGLDQGKLSKRKDEVDKKLDKNIVTYDDKTNTYKYKGENIKRENIGGNEGQKTLENRQNEVDKKLMSDNNEERSSTIETSADQKTTRKVVDFVGDNGQKIVTEKQNDDLSSTKTVDIQRGEREKVVTTQLDKEGNVVNKTKVKEDGDSFKEKAKDKDWVLKDKADQGKEFVSASKQDILNAIEKSKGLISNYEINIDGNGRINIQAKDKESQIQKNEFLNELNRVLLENGIVQIDMKNYKFKGEKNGNKDVVDKLIFEVGPDTKREVTKVETTAEKQPTVVNPTTEKQPAVVNPTAEQVRNQINEDFGVGKTPSFGRDENGKLKRN
ncbi:MAG: hypothetical protein WAZ12_05360 [Candidatus Absconditicoccaceae bacterium]